MIKRFSRIVLLAAWALGTALAAPANAASVVTEEFRISSKQGGVDLYLRNKHPEALYNVTSGKTVLFVHGASYPSHSSFDLPIDGQSWLDWLASKGYDVYALDLRGYGKSGRPPEMKQAAESNPPIVDTAQAAEDVSSAVEFILSRRNAQKLVLLGWSWGATVVGTYAGTNTSKVERLVLYAPQWLRDVTPPADVDMARVPAWRSVDPRDARNIWLKNVPAAKRDQILPKEIFTSWMNATLASDPSPAVPGTVRAPNGVVLDTMRYWASGKPRWNPDKVTAPTLVIQGEWDAEAPPTMGMAMFNQLTSSPFKRYVMVGETTHAALFEANRRQLYRAVQQFLEDPGP